MCLFALIAGVNILSGSTLTLFLFPCALLAVEIVHGFIHVYVQSRERLLGSTDALYYAGLLPELAVQLLRLCHYVHVWCAHVFGSFGAS